MKWEHLPVTIWKAGMITREPSPKAVTAWVDPGGGIEIVWRSQVQILHDFLPV